MEPEQFNANGFLGALGISAEEEQVYLAVLDSPLDDSHGLARRLSLCPDATRRILERIETRGLVSRSPRPPHGYLATPPKLALESLILQQQAVLERTRLIIPDLAKRAASAAPSPEELPLVEIIATRESMSQVLFQMQQTVRHELMAFQRAPLIFGYGFPAVQPAAGVATRTVSDESFLALPGALEAIRNDIGRGEHARIFHTLPFKMFIADRNSAIILIPLDSADTCGRSPTLLVRPSSLLDGLCALFELTWERSTPVRFTESGSLNRSTSLSDALEEMVTFLAAGLNDKAIAHEAGVSRATLNRRLTELMRSFGARTRFQLGWRAALDSARKTAQSDAALDR